MLVLLRGVLASLHTWDSWAPVLSQDYRMIRMDQPGFGLTGLAAGGSKQYDLEMVKDTVLKVRTTAALRLLLLSATLLAVISTGAWPWIILTRWSG